MSKRLVHYTGTSASGRLRKPETGMMLLLWGVIQDAFCRAQLVKHEYGCF